MNLNATVSERRIVNRKRSATHDLAKRDPLLENQMGWFEQTSQNRKLSSNAFQLSLSGRGRCYYDNGIHERNVTFRF